MNDPRTGRLMAFFLVVVVALGVTLAAVHEKDKATKYKDAYKSASTQLAQQLTEHHITPNVTTTPDVVVPGVRGAPGPEGSPGPVGTRGFQGARGPRGPRGIQGGRGPRGLAGKSGPTGSSGAQGVAGVNGTNGTDGTDGATGATGATGDQGPKGEKGDTGDSGVPGGPYDETCTGVVYDPVTATFAGSCTFASPAPTPSP